MRFDGPGDDRRLTLDDSAGARAFLVMRRRGGLLQAAKRAGFFSINVLRARHPGWFREDLEQLFGLLARGVIRPRVAMRIGLDDVAQAHRQIEAGGLEGKLVLCP